MLGIININRTYKYLLSFVDQTSSFKTTAKLYLALEELSIFTILLIENFQKFSIFILRGSTGLSISHYSIIHKIIISTKNEQNFNRIEKNY